MQDERDMEMPAGGCADEYNDVFARQRLYKMNSFNGGAPRVSR